MTPFDAGDLVRVPYPHVERPVMVMRPAVVISHRAVGLDRALLWTLMITNAQRPGWPGDLDIPDAVALGLIIPSKIRTAKVATIEAARATKLGALPAILFDEVRDVVRRTLGL